ncbi:MAG: hypothetical protein JXR97_01055 [Planctomycetes bacterium]|nr:hypothetical protein [Planctomycetota bacterium]
MKILKFTRCELVEVKIPFRFSFKHNLAERREANNIIVILHTSTGHIGYGEILPRPYLTGETVASAWDDLELLWWPKLRELSFEARNPASNFFNEKYKKDDTPAGAWIMRPGTTRDYFNTIRPIYDEADHARRTGSYAGLDIAAFDAWCRATNRPGNSMFGQPPAQADLSAVITGGSVRSARRLAHIFKWLGFKHFKLKVGENNDHNRLATVRKIIGYNRDLRVDANAAWDVTQAISMIKRFKEHRISSVEQPVPAEIEASELARIQEETGVALMADESLCTRQDAEKLAEAGASKIWNVRLAKVGGFSGMLEMIRLARDNFVRLHLGVLVGETSCLAAAGRACLGTAKFAHVEYGFPRVLLKNDPFRGGPGGYFGTGHPLSSAPGLGVRLIESKLNAVTVRRKVLD